MVIDRAPVIAQLNCDLLPGAMASGLALNVVIIGG